MLWGNCITPFIVVQFGLARIEKRPQSLGKLTLRDSVEAAE